MDVEAQRAVDVEAVSLQVGGEPAFALRAVRPGAEGPCPVYLHSPPSDSGDWRGPLGRTSGIAPDLPGSGRSAKGGHLDYGIAATAAFVIGLLDALGVGQVRLAAHGWSAGVALRMAALHPARVERLALCSPRSPGGGEGAPARLERLLRRPVAGELLMGFATRSLLGRRLRRGSVDPSAWPPERVAELWERFDQGTQRAILRRLRSQDPVVEPETVRLPALVLVGREDPWCGAEARALASRLPQGRLAEAPGGHWPWLDSSEAEALLAGWMSGAPAGAPPAP